MCTCGAAGVKMSGSASIELLEPRVAPAAAFGSSLSFSSDGRIATYTDVDGDHVTIAISSGKLSPENVNLSEPNETGQRLLLEA
jgi:hypothetical protein